MTLFIYKRPKGEKTKISVKFRNSAKNFQIPQFNFAQTISTTIILNKFKYKA